MGQVVDVVAQPGDTAAGRAEPLLEDRQQLDVAVQLDLLARSRRRSETSIAMSAGAFRCLRRVLRC